VHRLTAVHLFNIVKDRTVTEYFLPSHVHFCSRGDDFVFLDVKQDDYILVNGKAAAALSVLLLPGRAEEVRTDCTDALQELLQGGLLITDRSKGKDLRTTSATLAMEPLIDPEAAPRTRFNAVNVYRFITACTTAAIRLRRLPLDQTVRAVELRKQRRKSSQPFDTDQARDLTAIFDTLRALFPRNYLCLYDSLALLEFLAQYQIFPTWVFGVRLEPWQAHCWVQEGHFIFNEGVEEAAGYTPIMTI
jgi:hypothetical protein